MVQAGVLDEVDSLPSAKVDQMQGPAGRTMRLAKIRGQYADDFAGARDQRGAMHAAEPGAVGSLSIRRKELSRVNVLDDDPPPLVEASAASNVEWRIALNRRQILVVEPQAGADAKFGLVLIAQAQHA